MGSPRRRCSRASGESGVAPASVRACWIMKILVRSDQISKRGTSGLWEWMRSSGFPFQAVELSVSVEDCPALMVVGLAAKLTIFGIPTGVTFTTTLHDAVPEAPTATMV